MKYNDLNQRPWFGFIVIALAFSVFATCGMYLESQGLKRKPTAKAKLCACVIQVDSVPIPEDIVEGV